jgi:hypothetical protein
MTGLIFARERLVSLLALISLFLIIIAYASFYLKGSIPTSKYQLENTDKERRSFIESFGISLSPERAEKGSLKVPGHPEKALKEMERASNDMGLSLKPYEGHTLKKYTYKIKDSNLYVQLYIYENSVVSAIIVDPDIKNGEITSLLG